MIGTYKCENNQSSHCQYYMSEQEVQTKYITIGSKAMSLIENLKLTDGFLHTFSPNDDKTYRVCSGNDDNCFDITKTSAQNNSNLAVNNVYNDENHIHISLK